MRTCSEVEEKINEFEAFESVGGFDAMNAAILEALRWATGSEDELIPE